MTDTTIGKPAAPRMTTAMPSVMPAAIAQNRKASPSIKQSPPVVNSVLIHNISENTCIWGVVHGMTRSWHRYPDEGSFDVTGMSERQIAQNVVLAALEAVSDAGIEMMSLYAMNSDLREILLEVSPLIPGLVPVPDEPEWAQRSIQEASGLIDAWTTRIESQRRKDLRKKWLDKVGPLVVHVDASARINRNTIGIGFVVSDEVLDERTGNLCREYSYFSAKGTSSHLGGSTLAELTAISHAIKHGCVLTPEVKRNERALRIVSDSQESVNMLTAIRAGKPFHHPRTKEQMELAHRIVESLSKIANVSFEWVRGHDGDPRNEAADRLAVAARRNDEMDIPKEIASRMVSQIAKDTNAALSGKR